MDPVPSVPEPLAYHRDLRDYLRRREPAVWDWFASARARADHAEGLRAALLRSTYRIEPDSHPELRDALDDARARLGLDIPVTLYQATESPDPNATLYYIPGEGHIVFSGPVFTLLDEAELRSILGHELAHYLLFARDGGEFHVVDRIVDGSARDPRAARSHVETARLLRLYTEIFADRGSLAVAGALEPVVSGLVKIGTGLARVSAAAYLRQAGEILAKDPAATRAQSHPEPFVRARAAALWHAREPDAEARIAGWIEGAAAPGALDLLGQERLSAATRRLLARLLQPPWFQTPPVVAHARLFFPDFAPGHEPAEATAGFPDDAAARDFVVHVLLDFATADPALDELPLAAATELARELGMQPAFEKAATKQLGLKARDLKRLREQATELLARAATEPRHE